MTRYPFHILVTISAAIALVVVVQPSRHAQGKGTSRHDSALLNGMDCGDCHTTENWKLSALAGKGSNFDHDKTGFPLTGQHKKSACISCHKPKTVVKRSCGGCHQDLHRGRLGDACDECHGSTSWDTRASERHRQTRLPLTGMHSLLDCSSCHIRSTERQWTGASPDCFGCHEREYRGDIHPVHVGVAGESNPFPRDCSICHIAVAWTPAFADPDEFLLSATNRAPLNHDLRFPVRFGKHRGATCESCHVNPKVPKLVSCNGCHAHSRTQLRATHSTAISGSDGRACIRCHPGGVKR